MTVVQMLLDRTVFLAVADEEILGIAKEGAVPGDGRRLD
jgi:hypothetical protein